MTWELFYKIVAIWWVVRTIVGTCLGYADIIKTERRRESYDKSWKKRNTRYETWIRFPKWDIVGYDEYKITTDRPLNKVELDYIAGITPDVNRAEKIMEYLYDVRQIKATVNSGVALMLDSEEDE